ncbi:MAG: polymer-forming cytoskeletal protein [Pseudomonadota bacterium]
MFKRQTSAETGDRLGRSSDAADAETAQSDDAELETGARRPGVERSVIQPDLVIKGEILARGALELNGLVEGDVVARMVLVGENAVIRGDVIAEQVSISGDVRGEVLGHRVHLGAAARYFGNIRRGELSIDDGAVFEGNVRGLDDGGLRRIADRLDKAAPDAPNTVDVIAISS